MTCIAFQLNEKKKEANLLLSFLPKTDVCIYSMVYSIISPKYH